MQDDNTTENLKDKAKEQADSLGSYASRHPRRMWTGAFLIGMGTGMIASHVKKDNRSSWQKLVDNFSD